MDYQTLTISIADKLATVTLNRPDVRNAFNEQTINEIASAFDELGRNELVRAIVLAVGLVLAAVGAAAYELAAAVYRREPLDVGEPERHRRWTRS